MPQTRKSTKTQQQSLAAAFKATPSRITKPTSGGPKNIKATKEESTTTVHGKVDPHITKDDEQEKVEEIIPSDDEKEDSESEEEEVEQKEQEQEEFEPVPVEVIQRQLDLPKSAPEDVEEQAQKVTEKQIKKYYEDIKNSRITPTVHQESLTVHEKVLRHFDLSSQFGPCVGITRFKRWNRAYRLKLNPPVEVLAVLLKEDLGEGDDKKPKTESDSGSGVMAHVNDLLVTKVET